MEKSTCRQGKLGRARGDTEGENVGSTGYETRNLAVVRRGERARDRQDLLKVG